MLYNSKALFTLLAGLAIAGCAHDPLDIPCPDLQAGDLVLTEVHGPQTGEDRYGEWIEVFNASGRTIDLSGLEVRLTKLDGSSAEKLLVRDRVLIEPEGYAVFGQQPGGNEPDYVDYGYISDIDKKLFDSAAVEIRSCGEQVDLTVYRNLPTRGSLQLSGAINPPSADANDVELNWCVDDREDDNTPTLGIRGTPQEENPVCPE